MAELVNFVLGILVGTVAAIGLEMFRNLYFRPRLRILGDSPEHAEKFSSHAIRITNKGNRVARNCYGMITFPELRSLDLLPEDKIMTMAKVGLDKSKWNVEGDETYLLKLGDFRPIENESLAWSRVGNPLAIDIPPNTFALLDVCRFIKVGEKQIHVPSENGWRSVKAAIKNREYNIIISIAAENASVVKKRFVIEPFKDGIQIRDVT